jgi:hypothetical protein
MRRRLLGGLAALTLLLTTAACASDDDTKGMGDAPVATASTGHKGGDDSPATITNMPDHYGNAATKCVAGAPPWRLIEGTNFSSDSSFLVVQDPKKCGGTWVPGPSMVRSTVSSPTPPDDGS